MARRGTLTFFLVCFAGAALAEEGPRLPTARVSLTAGAALRSHVLFRPGEDYGSSSLGGFSPTALQLNAAWFPLAWLGADLDAAFTTFAAENAAGEKLQVAGGFAAPSVVGRWVPTPWLRLEGALGYGLQSEPFMLVALASPDTLASTGVFIHGPTAKVSVGVSLGRFDATLWARGLLGVGGRASVQALTRGQSAELGLRAGFAVLELDRVRATAVARVAARGAQANGFAFARDLDVGLGLEVSLVPSRPPPAPKEGLLRVEVRLPGGQPARGAVVRAGGKSGTVDDTGTRRLGVKPGELEVTATLAGFEAAREQIVASAAKETVVTLTLAPLTGPGTIKGRVQLEDGTPLAEVTVASAAGAKATTDAKGAFTLERAGPGVVGLTLTAAGYLKKEELVQVPPGGEAAVTVTLTPSTEPLKATLRGSIRSTTGRPVAAAVRISGSKTKVKVSADGRFEVQLEAGTWSLVISAPRHVTQTKSVTLAPGDQAIFQVDLQPGG